MTNEKQRNIELCNEICDIIEKSDCPKWALVDIFDITPDNIYKLKNGLIKPTVYQLIVFMDATRHTLDKICIQDYIKK